MAEGEQRTSQPAKKKTIDWWFVFPSVIGAALVTAAIVVSCRQRDVTSSASEVEATSAKLSGHSRSENVIIAHGFFWGTTKDPVQERQVEMPIREGGFAANSNTETETLLEGLRPETTYYFVSYILEEGPSGEFFYSALHSFTTPASALV